MGGMHVVLLQMEHPIVLPIIPTEHVTKQIVVMQMKHPIVLPIILMEHVQVPSVVRKR